MVGCCLLCWWSTRYVPYYIPLASKYDSGRPDRPQTHPENKSKNFRPATRSVLTSSGGGSRETNTSPGRILLGYPLIPYSAASDLCSWRCVNHESRCKKNCILSAPAARLAPHRAYLLSPKAAPLAQHGGGIRAVVLIVFSNVNTLVKAVSCFSYYRHPMMGESARIIPTRRMKRRPKTRSKTP